MPRVVLLPDASSRGLWQASTFAIEPLTSLLSTPPIMKIGLTHGTLQVRLYEAWALCGEEGGVLKTSLMLNCLRVSQPSSDLIKKWMRSEGIQI